MDQLVLDAIAKWPNVPACTGWLLLDRRGQWRMRDDACQAAGDAGDAIRHTALKAFIERNYEADEAGRWFFQNGPQRVFVDLAYTPYVVRLQMEGGSPLLTDQCGRPFLPDTVWLDDQGNVLFSAHNAGHGRGHGHGNVALLHDHDLALFADGFADAFDGESFGLDGQEADRVRTLPWAHDARLPVRHILMADVPERFAFVQRPALAA